MALKTDYKDDIPKTQNRRYQMIHNDDGTVSFVDVTEYTQVGDTFGAGDINATNESVNGKVESTDIVDPALVTQAGFAADALAVKKQFDEQNKKLETSNVGYHARKLFNVSEMTNVTTGTILVTNRNSVVSVKINDLSCTLDAPLIDLSPYVGVSYYLYDSDCTGLYIDNSKLYSSKASIQHMCLTFVL